MLDPRVTISETKSVNVKKIVVIIGVLLLSVTGAALILMWIFGGNSRPGPQPVSPSPSIPQIPFSVYQMSGFPGSNTSNSPGIFIANGPTYGSWLKVQTETCVAANPDWMVVSAECCKDIQGMVYVKADLNQAYAFVPEKSEGDHVSNGCSNLAFSKNDTSLIYYFSCCQGCTPRVYDNYTDLGESSGTGPFVCM
jgi:hypothetical protein